MGVGGGGADTVGGQLVDANGLPVEIAFDGAGGIIGAESGRTVGRAGVVKVGRQNGLGQESGPCGGVLFDPGRDVVEAVVALRDDEE